MNKICCDIKQSKKLIKLGIDVDTADMYRHYDEDFSKFDLPQIIDYGEGSFNKHHCLFPDDIPAWSLSALLQLFDDKAGIAKEYDTWFAYDNGKSHCSKHYDSPLDAAFEMVVYLKENNLL